MQIISWGQYACESWWGGVPFIIKNFDKLVRNCHHQDCNIILLGDLSTSSEASSYNIDFDLGHRCRSSPDAKTNNEFKVLFGCHP